MLWLAEEEYRQKEFNIRLMSDEMKEKLRLCNMSESGLGASDYSACNYHIISNPEYQEKLKYAPAGLRNNT